MTRVELVGNVAVVTGVSSGIGAAAAIALAEAGANVAGVFVGDDSDADPVRERIEAAGRQHNLFVADMADSATSDRLCAAAVDRWGSLDIWVNNAARLLVKPLVDTTDEDLSDLLALNLFGYLYGCRAAARHMFAAGNGRIINIASAADVLAVANLSAYITAKGGVVGLTKTLALEAAPHGVTVNAVAPGAIETPLNADAYTDDVRSTYEERIPLGRIGLPSDVSSVILFLASTGSAYLTGQEIIVDGGLVIDGTVGHANSGGD